MAANTILERLHVMAARLGLSSQQVMLIYAANAGWTNNEMTAAGVNILQKIAGDNQIDLYDEEPFIVQLIAKGVILPSEASCFGWKVKENAETENPDNRDTAAANGAGTNGTAKPLGACY